jgi:hypothetical protein
VGFVLLTSAAGHADEVFDYPGAGSKPAESPPPVAPAAPGPETTFRVTLHSRWGAAAHWVRASQDVIQGTSVAVFEAEQRRSRSLLFSVGVRARHGFAQRDNGDARYELDLAPVSAFVDATPDTGVHLRAGYQHVTMGRFDAFSATNFLAVYDLRSGPVTMQEAAAIAQPAIRFDLDRLRGFTLQTYYLPFFQPHMVSVYGSDYALLSPYDRYIDGAARADPSSPLGVYGRSGVSIRNALESAFGRSGSTGALTNAIQAFGPAPDLSKPQGAIRGTFHGSAGELSGTVGTALERLPAITLDATTFVKVDYGRFAVASLDAATDVGPLQIGAEVAYMAHRTLIATRPGPPLSANPGLPSPQCPAGADPLTDTSCALTLPERVNMAQVGLRAELVEAAGWAAEVEVFAAAALADPSNRTLRWFSMDEGRWWRGVAGGVHWAPEGTHLRLELAGAVFSGPSYVALPRAEWEASHGLFLEVGAAIVEGPTPGAPGSPGVALGGLFNDVDHVFTGVRWVL